MEIKKQDGPRINEAIRVKEVRVIDGQGNQLGVIPTHEARRLAKEAGLDLVEVSPNVKPPVCKMLDYGRFKFEQKKHAAEQKKKQKIAETKTVKFSPVIEDHDFNTKISHIKEFLEEGNKVLASLQFFGRHAAHPELGKEVLERVVQTIKDHAKPEDQIRSEGKVMFVLLNPIKKATVKPEQTNA